MHLANHGTTLRYVQNDDGWDGITLLTRLSQYWASIKSKNADSISKE